MTMEFKEGQKVNFIHIDGEWTIKWVDTSDRDNMPYFIVGINGAHTWAKEADLTPCPPKESRKHFKSRIKEMDYRLTQQSKTIDELRKQLVSAQDAVKIVEALERMPKASALRHGDNSWWVTRSGSNESGCSNTIKDALIAAGLLKDGE